MNNTLCAAPVLLVVDGHVETRKLFSIILSAEGYDIIEAGNGADALAALQRHQVMGIITDLQLPQMDGCQLARAARTDSRLQHVPVALVTCNAAMLSLRMRGLFLSVVQKPCSPVQLIHTAAGLAGYAPVAAITASAGDIRRPAA